MELTLRTPAAIGALQEIRSRLPEMTAGIGTILEKSQVDEVIDAGAAFGVSPAVNTEVMNYATERGLPFIHALVMVTDAATGRPLSVMDGEYLTALRTGAGAGLATDLLARPDAAVAALFGAGVQHVADLVADRVLVG